MSMKIIQVCPRFLPCIGGVETHVYEISRRLAKNNEVFVFTTDSSGKLPKEEIIDGIKVRRFKSFAPNESYFFSFELLSALKKENCDILHSHSFHSMTSFLSYLATDKCKPKKFIFTPHYNIGAGSKFRDFLHIFYDPIQKKLFWGANKVICVSRYEKDIIKKKFGVSEEKIVYIPNGLNLEEFDTVEKQTKLYDFEILFVGRLEKYKRVHEAIYALKPIIEKYPDKNIHFTIVGKGPYKQSLIKLTNDLNLSDKVSFEEDVPKKDLIKIYKRADVLCMLNRYEAFSIVTFEALACNKPVIAPNVGVFKEHKKNNYSIFLFDNNREFISILESMIGKEYNFKNNLESYDWSEITKKIESVYSDGE